MITYPPRGRASAVRAVIAGSAAAALAAAFLATPAALAALPPICPFRIATGLPCPGCGLGHSFVALAQGDVAGSFLAHPFGPVAFAGCVVLLALAAAGWLRGARRADRAAAMLRGPAFLVAAVWIAWAALRAGSA
jgi:hypothetical protein